MAQNVQSDFKMMNNLTRPNRKNTRIVIISPYNNSRKIVYSGLKKQTIFVNNIWTLQNENCHFSFHIGLRLSVEPFALTN